MAWQEVWSNTKAGTLAGRIGAGAGFADSPSRPSSVPDYPAAQFHFPGRRRRSPAADQSESGAGPQEHKEARRFLRRAAMKKWLSVN